jgi:hypothetical protein
MQVLQREEDDRNCKLAVEQEVDKIQRSLMLIQYQESDQSRDEVVRTIGTNQSQIDSIQ